jgi:hypothetical protein
LPTIHLIAEGWNKHREKSADDVWWDSEELLRDDGSFGINRSDDGRQEERKALNSDVVQSVFVSLLMFTLSRHVQTYKKMTEVDRVRGLRMPAKIFALSILSKTSVVPRRSVLIRLIANAFSSSVSHLADSGRSVSVAKRYQYMRCIPNLSKLTKGDDR